MPKVVQKIRLHPVQRDFRQSSALYRAFCGGRGAGKTWVGAYDMLRRCRPGRTYLIGSPTGVILGDTTFPTFKALATSLGIWGGAKLTPYPNATILLDGGEATIRFRTAEDPERMRGPNLSGVWLDEASLMPEDAYKISIASLREAGQQGWLSATFTPKGRYHWTFIIFGVDPPKENTQLFRAATGDNPFNPAGFEQTLAGQYSHQFARQELYGEFLNIEGAEFPGEYFPDSLYFTDWPKDLQFLVIALDPSKGKDAKHGDYSALVALGRCKEGKLWIEADLARRPTTQIVSDGIEFARRVREETGAYLEGFGVEANAFQELLADQFVRQTRETGFALPIYKINNTMNKETRIRRLTPDIMSRSLRFRATPGTRLLVQQLQEFPVSDYDDGPDALEMAKRLAVDLWNGKHGKGKR